MQVAPRNILNNYFFLPNVLLTLTLSSSAVHAQYILEDVSDPKRYELGTLAVPIGYWNDSLKAALGVAGYTDGLFQPQVTEYEFLIGSFNGSYGLVVGLDALQLKPIDRLFFRGEFYYFRTEADDNSVTIGGNPRFGRGAAGENTSNQHNFIQSASNDCIGTFTFKYLLPIGDGRDRLIDHYILRDGLLAAGESGGHGWNPLKSGRTFIQVTPEFEFMDIRSTYARRHQWDTNNISLGLLYDNRDWPLTPSSGNMTSVSVQRDFGIEGSSNSWTNVSAEFAQYIPLGTSGAFRQQVLALDGWTSYSPTWHQSGSGAGKIVRTAPPFYDGAALGGMDKMRGYPEERYHDRAAVFGCAELRLIPRWNPLREISLFKSADIAWMQFVAFAEIGRVADEYTFDKLFSNMRTDYGVGIRVMTQDTVVRIDLAYSREGIQVWANLDQAF